MAFFVLFLTYFIQHDNLKAHPCMCVCVCVCVSAQSLLAVCNPMGCSPKVPLYMEFSRQEYWSGLLLPTIRDLSDPGSEPMFFVSPALAGVFFSTVPTACFQGLSMLLQMVLFCYFYG